MSSSEAAGRGGEASWVSESQLRTGPGKLDSEGRKLPARLPWAAKLGWGVPEQSPSFKKLLQQGRPCVFCDSGLWGPAAEQACVPRHKSQDDSKLAEVRTQLTSQPLKPREAHSLTAPEGSCVRG